MKNYLPRPSEIWLVDLRSKNDIVGREIYKRRPALVLSSRYRVALTQMAGIAPISSNMKEFPTHIPIKTRSVKGMLFIEYNRSVALERFIKKSEDVSPDILSETREAVMVFNGIRISR